MTNIEIGILGVAATLILIAARIPIGVVLGVVAFCGITLITNLKAALSITSVIPYNFITDWNLSAIPTFLAMGFIASEAGLTNGLFAAIRMFLWRIPGGMASATVVSSAMFASASGSSIATAAAFSRIAVPEMLKAKYNVGLATGSVAAAGTLGSLIPPSILMILYGIFTSTSIASLFLAGVLPGLLSAAMFIAMITFRCWRSPKLAPATNEQFSWEEKKAALKDIWALPVLVGFVLGGIFFGIFSPTEAGAIGAFLSALIGFSRRSLSFEGIQKSLTQAVYGTSSIFIIGLGASIYVRFLGLSGLPVYLADLLLPVTSNEYLLIAMISILFIVLGMFVDSLAILLLTLPIVMPLVIGLGIDTVWFGIIVIKLLEIGLITPPVGLNAFVIKSSLGNLVSLNQIFAGIFWFFLMEVLTLGALIYWPQISLFLPSLAN
ncbi:TRAP transporter large permease [Sneathiella marina]|uniref:TRAP transporter large permease protein n=1 Tax=Sneathiella marina TaxID=2950108 RepID=A0ABY4W421_9PROT|nr:TRAP transporter large permease [Sneathiella marina]USG61576.1 TRAP transporter large permease [Sneathiella marina]